MKTGKHALRSSAPSNTYNCFRTALYYSAFFIIYLFFLLLLPCKKFGDWGEKKGVALA